mgnify:CR=1 FL=1
MQPKKLVYCLDLDGTICSDTNGKYAEAKPIQEIIDKINTLYEQGNTITIYTARGATTGIDWRALTEKQLHKWGVKYHKLLMNKPYGDLFVDDRAVNVKDW